MITKCVWMGECFEEIQIHLGEFHCLDDNFENFKMMEIYEIFCSS